MTTLPQAPEAPRPAQQRGLKAPRKKVTFTIWNDGTITSKFETVPGSGMERLPVTRHELNQLQRALHVGFRKQMLDYKRGQYSTAQPETAQEPDNEPV